MTTSDTTMDSSVEKQSDMLLWYAAAGVVGIGLVWLLISQPWSGNVSGPPVAPPPRVATTAPATPPASPSAVSPAGNSDLDNPLRMAELAYEAGMLVEPADYSAWALFSRALEEDPESMAARDGLNRVADDLVKRGTAAIEQGRFDDAKAAVERIVGVLPDHAGAEVLASRIEELAPRPTPPPAPLVPRREDTPQPRIEARARPAPPVAPPVIEQAQPQPQVDPFDEAHAAFSTAMAENRLLTPADDNARQHVERLIELRPDDELTGSARDLLVTEMLGRSAQAIEALDLDAARTWIDQAEALSVNSGPIAIAHERLDDKLIELESAKRLPVSTLTVTNYVAPRYPRSALQRNVEGWVDLEFTVRPDGRTANVTIADASHSSFFHDEAIEAVEQWRFEPRMFMNRPIAQQTFTRLRFVLGE